VGGGKVLEVVNPGVAHDDLAAEPVDLLEQRGDLDPEVHRTCRCLQGDRELGQRPVESPDVVLHPAQRRRHRKQPCDAEGGLHLERGLERDLARHHRTRADLLGAAAGDQGDVVALLEEP
jgi:hypothetical protein